MNKRKAAELFTGWEEALIWSCLQGYMGNLISDNEENPISAVIDIGDFCFFAGKPSRELLGKISGSKLLIPKDPPWEQLIEEFYGDKVKKFFRYAVKKESDAFDVELLNDYIKRLDSCYELKMFNKQIFEMAKSESWSVDLCSQFENFYQYQNRAVGTAILHDGKLVAGASPYAVYDKGIEIEIDTKPEYRRKGLATVCGAKLILTCLERCICPHWDAHDLRSVALAEKLGYHLDRPYITYELAGDR